jgi:hypothetical protein
MAMKAIKLYLGLLLQGEKAHMIREKNMFFVGLRNAMDDPKSFKYVFFREINKRMFRQEMEEYELTYDITKLKAKIRASSELLGSISLAYFEQGQPEWMLNSLKPILQNETIDNLLIIARNAVFRELHEAIDSPVLFIFVLMNEYRNKQIFASDNAGLPTSDDITKLKLEIQKRPDLLHEIEIAYRRAGQPEWMRNLLQYLT